MIRIEDVKMWGVSDGIGHAIAQTKDYWSFTACGTLSNMPRTEALPKRICKRCRERLRNATANEQHMQPDKGAP